MEKMIFSDILELYCKWEGLPNGFALLICKGRKSDRINVMEGRISFWAGETKSGRSGVNGAAAGY
jgi:hypothetical protein